MFKNLKKELSADTHSQPKKKRSSKPRSNKNRSAAAKNATPTTEATTSDLNTDNDGPNSTRSSIVSTRDSVDSTGSAVVGLNSSNTLDALVDVNRIDPTLPDPDEDEADPFAAFVSTDTDKNAQTSEQVSDLTGISGNDVLVNDKQQPQSEPDLLGFSGDLMSAPTNAVSSLETAGDMDIMGETRTDNSTTANNQAAVDTDPFGFNVPTSGDNSASIIPENTADALDPLGLNQFDDWSSGFEGSQSGGRADTQYKHSGLADLLGTPTTSTSNNSTLPNESSWDAFAGPNTTPYKLAPNRPYTNAMSMPDGSAQTKNSSLNRQTSAADAFDVNATLSGSQMKDLWGFSDIANNISKTPVTEETRKQVPAEDLPVSFSEFEEEHTDAQDKSITHPLSGIQTTGHSDDVTDGSADGAAKVEDAVEDSPGRQNTGVHNLIDNETQVENKSDDWATGWGDEGEFDANNTGDEVDSSRVKDVQVGAENEYDQASHVDSLDDAKVSVNEGVGSTLIGNEGTVLSMENTASGETSGNDNNISDAGIEEPENIEQSELHEDQHAAATEQDADDLRVEGMEQSGKLDDDDTEHSKEIGVENAVQGDEVDSCVISDGSARELDATDLEGEAAHLDASADAGVGEANESEGVERDDGVMHNGDMDGQNRTSNEFEDAITEQTESTDEQTEGMENQIEQSDITENSSVAETGAEAEDVSSIGEKNQDSDGSTDRTDDTNENADMHTQRMHEHTENMHEHTESMHAHTEDMESHKGSMLEHKQSMEKHSEDMEEHSENMEEHAESMEEHTECMEERKDCKDCDDQGDGNSEYVECMLGEMEEMNKDVREVQQNVTETAIGVLFSGERVQEAADEVTENAQAVQKVAESVEQTKEHVDTRADEVHDDAEIVQDGVWSAHEEAQSAREDAENVHAHAMDVERHASLAEESAAMVEDSTVTMEEAVQKVEETAECVDETAEQVDRLAESVEVHADGVEQHMRSMMDMVHRMEDSAQRCEEARQSAEEVAMVVDEQVRVLSDQVQGQPVRSDSAVFGEGEASSASDHAGSSADELARPEESVEDGEAHESNAALASRSGEVEVGVGSGALGTEECPVDQALAEGDAANEGGVQSVASEKGSTLSSDETDTEMPAKASTEDVHTDANDDPNSEDTGESGSTDSHDGASEVAEAVEEVVDRAIDEALQEVHEDQETVSEEHVQETVCSELGVGEEVDTELDVTMNNTTHVVVQSDSDDQHTGNVEPGAKVESELAAGKEVDAELDVTLNSKLHMQDQPDNNESAPTDTEQSPEQALEMAQEALAAARESVHQIEVAASEEARTVTPEMLDEAKNAIDGAAEAVSDSSHAIDASDTTNEIDSEVNKTRVEEGKEGGSSAEETVERIAEQGDVVRSGENYAQGREGEADATVVEEKGEVDAGVSEGEDVESVVNEDENSDTPAESLGETDAQETPEGKDVGDETVIDGDDVAGDTELGTRQAEDEASDDRSDRAEEPLDADTGESRLNTDEAVEGDNSEQHTDHTQTAVDDKETTQEQTGAVAEVQSVECDNTEQHNDHTQEAVDDEEPNQEQTSAVAEVQSDKELDSTDAHALDDRIHDSGDTDVAEKLDAEIVTEKNCKNPSSPLESTEENPAERDESKNSGENLEDRTGDKENEQAPPPRPEHAPPPSSPLSRQRSVQRSAAVIAIAGEEVDVQRLEKAELVELSVNLEKKVTKLTSRMEQQTKSFKQRMVSMRGKLDANATASAELSTAREELAATQEKLTQSKQDLRGMKAQLVAFKKEDRALKDKLEATDAMNVSIKTQLRQTLDRLDTEKVHRENVQVAASELTQEVEGLKSRVKDLDTTERKLLTTEQQLSDAQEMNSELKGILDNQQREITDMQSVTQILGQDMDALKAALAQSNKLNDAAEKEKELLKRQLQESNSKVNNYESVCQSQTAEMQLLRDTVDKTNKEKDTLQQQIGVLEGRAETWEERYTRVANAEETSNQNLKNEVESLKEQLNTRTSELAQANKEREELENTRKDTETEVRKVTERLEASQVEVDEKERIIQSLESTATSTLEARHTTISELDTLKRELEEIKAQHQEENAHSQQTIRNLKKKMVDLKRTLSKHVRASTNQNGLQYPDLPGTDSAGSLNYPASPQMRGHNDETMSPVYKPQTPHEDKLDRVPTSDAPDVMYLKNVILKFLTARSVERKQLVPVLATILNFSANESQLARNSLEKKWFSAS